jgi:hypothetical protein
MLFERIGRAVPPAEAGSISCTPAPDANLKVRST